MTKTLVIKAKGGMGNRMLCTVTGLLYAEMSNRQPVVDWADGAYAPEGVNAFPFFFNTENYLTELPSAENTDIFPAIWNGNLAQSVSGMIHKHDPTKHSSILIHRKYSVDPSCYDIPEKIAVYWSYTERIRRLGKGLSRVYPEVGSKNKYSKLKYFTPRFLKLRQSIQQEKETLKESIWTSRMIGVHVRFTDRKIGLDKYEKPLRKMLERYPDASIFLATDNPRVSEIFKDRYSHVITLKKWYPADTGALHQNYSCPDKVRNGVEALLDMYLLAECDALIYPGNSTFSWVSAILSKAPPENIVDVTGRNMKIQLKRLIREYIQ